MWTRAVTMTGSALQLSGLLGIADNCQSVTLENIAGNSVLYWGDQTNQIMTLAAGSKISIPVTNLKNLWLLGTNTDVINVSVFG